MKIPVENIYYLLCYAWDKLDEGNRLSVSIDSNIGLPDLFAKVLINATKILLKKGIYKNFVDSSVELAGVKGKLDLSETLKRNLLFKQRTVCTFDELSTDILLNQILVSTLHQLASTESLDEKLREEIVTLLRMLKGVKRIQLKEKYFTLIRLTRNSSFYGLILNVCQIIFENSLPSEYLGKYIFKEFVKDERKMSQLFEAFIRNFYKKEQKRFPIVKKENIQWQLTPLNFNDVEYLPQMQTDITLESDREKLIIDAKFYKEAMALNYNKQKIKSENLYQIFSYLLNQETSNEKTIKATGILLYPTVNKDYDLCFNYRLHRIYIKTINLNTNWRDIFNRLQHIISLN